MKFIVCRSATQHTAHCSGGEGHPHSDCYCDVYWNDDEPKSPCEECAETTPTPAAHPRRAEVNGETP